MKNLRLWCLLAIVFGTVILFVVSILYCLTLHQNSKFIRSSEEHLLMSIGEQLSIEPQIITALENNNSNPDLETYVNKISELHGLDFVVLLNMAAIRLTHPNKSMIGKHFDSEDAIDAFKGQKHVSVSEGSLGQSLRAFIPVYSRVFPDKQIGVVTLGIRIQSLNLLIKYSGKGYLLTLVTGVILAFLASLGLAFYLKKQLHNLEPKEIARLLEERNAMLEETNDAIVVLNMDKRINLANIAANQLYQKNSGHSDTLTGKPLQELMVHNQDIDLEQASQQIYRQNGQDYLLSSSPIIVGNKKIGWIIFLRNTTELFFMIDQLANTTAYASALQSQSHEFMNKLHVIYGLADLKAYDELKIYLDDILTPEKKFSRRLSFLVSNPQIAGFLTGEQQKFSERKIDLSIEVSPEIPKNNIEEETRSLIELYRYIHHVLLHSISSDNLQMIIHYEKNLLTTIYHIEISQHCHIKDRFDSNYFRQMLKENKATFVIDIRYKIVFLKLKTCYTEVVK